MLYLSTLTKLLGCFTLRDEWVESLNWNIPSKFPDLRKKSSIDPGNLEWNDIETWNVKSPTFKLLGTWRRSWKAGD